MVEEKLELFVGQIDAELLKSVHGEVLETKDVKDSCKYRKSKPQMSHALSSIRNCALDFHPTCTK